MLTTAELMLLARGTATTASVTAKASDPTTTNSKDLRPAYFKIVGILLATASGLLIGASFVLKKVGLLKANVKYNEEAGEGYGYLRDLYWWCGMTLMMLGELCNFVAYAFVDAILVTPLGALAVVVTAVLSAIFLKERLSFIGQIGCFCCIIGSVVIALNAPQQSSVSNIQEMQHYVIAPGFLSYGGVIIIGSAFLAFWAGPRYGKKNMFVYITICSLIGGLSVVATQGLGSAIVAQAQGQEQFKHWFLYILLVFVVCTLLTEIVYLNKALNLFNAALVTPTYYVMFTSSTIVASAVLFRGFEGTAVSITTVVLGFLQICSGVVLLQLSKSAKDIPDTAVFKGDLDQVREVAEQEQPESEPQADAIRGTAAIVRRISTVRRKRENEEAKRIQEDKKLDLLSPPKDGEIIEWDGVRRRRSVLIPGTPYGSLNRTRTVSRASSVKHPPLGMSKIPDQDSIGTHSQSIPSHTPLRAFSFFGSLRHPVWKSLNHSDKESTQMAHMKKSDPYDEQFGVKYNEETQYCSPSREIATSAGGDSTASEQSSYTSKQFSPLKDGGSLKKPSFSSSNLFTWGSGRHSTITRRVFGSATEEERLGLVDGDDVHHDGYLNPVLENSEDNYEPDFDSEQTYEPAYSGSNRYGQAHQSSTSTAMLLDIPMINRVTVKSTSGINVSSTLLPSDTIYESNIPALPHLSHQQDITARSIATPISREIPQIRSPPPPITLPSSAVNELSSYHTSDELFHQSLPYSSGHTNTSVFL